MYVYTLPTFIFGWGRVYSIVRKGFEIFGQIFTPEQTTGTPGTDEHPIHPSKPRYGQVHNGLEQV